MANADICGACHSRYSYTVGTFTIDSDPDALGRSAPIQPQMALGYNDARYPEGRAAAGTRPLR